MDQARDAGSPDGDLDGQPDVATHEAVNAPVASATPMTASARLRAAREALGLTTTDVAARTRITLRHVNALDRGDLASLPGRPYVLGFIRSYARAVGLDEAEMTALARTELDAGTPNAAPRQVHQFDVEDPAKTPSRLLTLLALALFVIVLVAGGVFWRSYYAPGAELPSLALPDPASAPTHAPVAAATAAAPAPTNSGPVVFTAREDAIWVKFYDGHGQQLMQKQLALGESYTVPADAFEPKLWTGRPDALTITIGGQAVPALSDHRGIVKDIPVSAQGLLARAQPAAPAINGLPAPSSVSSAPATAHVVRHKARRASTGDSVTPDAAPAAEAPPAPAPTTGGTQ